MVKGGGSQWITLDEKRCRAGEMVQSAQTERKREKRRKIIFEMKEQGSENKGNNTNKSNMVK